VSERTSNIRQPSRGHSGDSVPRLLAGTAQSLLLLAALTAAALALRLNAASAGFFLLAGVLLVASRQPLAVASVAAIGATLSYNFFFFPPTRTLTVHDPENWIALATFLLTSLVANRLLVRERLQAENARSSREDIEALYELSVSLLKNADDLDQIGDAAVRYLARIGAASGGVILFGSSPQHQQVLAWTGAPISDEVEDIAAGVGRHGRVTDIPSRFGRDVCLPLAVSGRVRAALVVRSTAGTRGALESAANLLAFAIERERFTRERAHVEALQETNELKTSLLQAVSHDLKSPLTVLSVESEALEHIIRTTEPAAASHVRVIRDEVARLHRRINNLLAVARFEAGILSPSIEPTPPADLFRAARESLPTITAARPIQTTVSDDTTDLLVDPSLALEIVINLIENAHRASPPASPIELSAVTSPEIENRVWVEVRDRGTGLPPEQARRIRTIEPPDAHSRGLGIELARTLAVLSGGSVEWFARPGGGTIARLDLPAARVIMQETV
jgi:two-component system sensor histidine kinase KdpD